MVAMIAACGFALWKGSEPERAGSAWMITTYVAVQLAGALVGKNELPLVIMAADGVLATALLFLSIQYASLWLGGAMLLQSTAFALHSWFLLEPALDRTVGERNFYVTAVNLLSVSIILLLTFSTASRWRRRVRNRRSGGHDASRHETRLDPAALPA